MSLLVIFKAILAQGGIGGNSEPVAKLLRSDRIGIWQNGSKRGLKVCWTILSSLEFWREVWTAVKALPVPVIVGIAVGVFIVTLVGIKLILKFIIKPQAKQTLEDEHIPKLAVKPSSGRRESD